LTQHRFYSQEKLPKEVMLIDETGTNVGIVPGQDAKLKADLLGLAVSIVAPNAKPPVARIFSKQDLSAMKAKVPTWLCSVVDSFQRVQTGF
jgi:translation initiation factor IF-3